jgi:hypothetical protein
MTSLVFLYFASWLLNLFVIFTVVMLLLVISALFFMRRFEQAFMQDVSHSLKSLTNQSAPLVTLEDLQHLPEPVRNYLIHAGVIGKPQVQDFFLRFDGEMRDKGKDWFRFSSQQYNTIHPASRLFFMKAKMFGITVPGYHAYGNGKASMDIRLFGIIPVVSHHEKEMFKTESVTFLNDVCLFAPAALIGSQFQWETIDDVSASVKFRNGDTQVRATLYFNEKNELVDFVSDDRMAVADMTTYRFSTPVGNYKSLEGYLLSTYGKAIWHYPEGMFTYGRFHLKEIKFNRSL